MARGGSATVFVMKGGQAERPPVVRALPFGGGDEALIAGIRAGQSGAAVALVERYGNHIERVLYRVLGSDPDLPDVLHDVIAHALTNIDQVRSAEALKAWLTQVAVFCARGVIRKRQRRRWLTFWSPADLPEVAAPESTPEVRDVLAATYEILAQLPSEERVAFSLRFIDQMELADVAAALDVSLATVKRVLRRAESRFLTFAKRYPVVVEAISQGTRWKEAP